MTVTVRVRLALGRGLRGRVRVSVSVRGRGRVAHWCPSMVAQASRDGRAFSLNLRCSISRFEIDLMQTHRGYIRGMQLPFGSGDRPKVP